MFAIGPFTVVKLDVGLIISISSSCRVVATIVGIVAGGSNRSGYQHPPIVVRQVLSKIIVC
jgi:hypothetical protein